MSKPEFYSIICNHGMKELDRPDYGVGGISVTFYYSFDGICSNHTEHKVESTLLKNNFVKIKIIFNNV